MSEITPQLLVSLDSDRAIEMIVWLVYNVGISNFKTTATRRRDGHGNLNKGMYSKLSMSDADAVMFKLTFPEAKALDSIDPKSLSESIYFFDNRKYQKTSSPNVDFWCIIPPETFP